jgi:hypothetical protein
MNKQWIYRNGEKPFSVTEIKTPNGEIFLHRLKMTVIYLFITQQAV